MPITFEPYPKIGRFQRSIVITEKLDGTNAQIIITDDGEIGAASRTRIITPGKLTDNYGFAAWVEAYRNFLLPLGPGRHYGEWYGNGIQRGYGLNHKRFALFNPDRYRNNLPECCEVVPVLYHGPMDQSAIDNTMTALATNGSQAVPGFMQPEGIIVYHTGNHSVFKRTFEHDENGKEAA